MPYDVTIKALAPFGMVDIRGRDDVRDICGRIMGISLPNIANTATRLEERIAFCISPDHWLIRTPDGDEVALVSTMQEKTAGLFKAITIVSDNYLTFRIAGPEVLEMLMQGVDMDLHPHAFGVNSCARAGFAKTTALLYKLDEQPTFDICIYRSYGDYVQQWLDYVIGL